MPFTPDMRRKVDQIRDYLYGGGYPDPLSNAEQLSFLFFFYMIEGIDAANLRQAKATKRDYTSLFAGDWTLRNPLNAPTKGVETIPRERMRWSSWANAMSGEQLVTFVRDEVFPFFASVGDAFGMSFMAQVRLAIDEPTVLTQIVTLVNELRLEQADPDTKGDLFEHVLRQIKQAGELGQFRTPRHIIRAIVDLVDPKIGETVYDPAAGTAGFLVAAYEHIRLANSSANGRDVAELEGKRFERGYGDRLNAAQWRKLQTATFFGSDVDPKMVSLASMNLALRGLPDVRILKRNVLTTSFDRQTKAEKNLPLDGYDVVLANPPFSGRIDRDRIVDDVKIGASTATELLFVKYMIDNLKSGGRCGVVVPEGVLFGSTGAHKELRRILMQNNRVEAVLSLPGGVFQPYSGVKTSVLVFAKGGRTERVMFLHASNDGFKLDANHDQPIDADDLPGLIAAFNNRENMWAGWQARDAEQPWMENWWFADAAVIEGENWNFSASRYRPESREAAEHRDPCELLEELQEDVTAILGDIETLAAELGGANGVSVPIVELVKVCRMDRQTTSAADAIGMGLEFVGMEHVDPNTGRIAVANGSRTGDGKGQAFLFDDRHVLFGKLRPYLRKIAIPDKKGCSSTELVPLLPDSKQLDRAYLFHWVRRRQVIDTLMAKNTGARMPRADMSVLLSMSIPLPALDEQRRIVGLLDRAAEIRRRADVARAKARAIIPPLFLDTFGDPATNPKAWPIVEVRDLVDRIDGGWSPTCDGGIPTYNQWGVLKLSAVKSSGFDAEEAKLLPNQNDARRELEVRDGDLLFTRKNTLELVGTAAVVRGSPCRRMLPDTVFRLVPTSQNSFRPEYLCTLINLATFRPVIRQLASGSAASMPGISKGRLQRLRVPLPPTALQLTFAEQVRRLELLARHLDAAAAKAEGMAAALSAKVFDQSPHKGNGHAGAQAGQ